jgi:hypothetical protein
MRTARCSVDVRSAERTHRTLRVSRRLFQTDTHAVAFVFEFLEAMLLHELEQLLDFPKIHSSRMPFLR